MSIFGVLSEALQAAGAGLTLSATLETSYEEHAGIGDYLSIVLGAGLWMSGVYLERWNNRRPIDLDDLPYQEMKETPQSSRTTTVIKKLLLTGSGFSLASALTKVIKDFDATSKISELFFSCFLNILALWEYKRAQNATLVPKIPLEFLRYAATFCIDLFLMGTVKHGADNEIDISDVPVFAIALTAFILEWVYGLKNDENISFLSKILRRFMKMAPAVGVVFLADDLLKGNTEKYPMSDDVFLGLNGGLILTVLWLIRKMGKDLAAQQQQVLQYEEYEAPQYRVNSDDMPNSTVVVIPRSSPTNSSVFAPHFAFNAVGGANLPALMEPEGDSNSSIITNTSGSFAPTSSH